MQAFELVFLVSQNRQGWSRCNRRRNTFSNRMRFGRGLMPDFFLPTQILEMGRQWADR